MKQIQLTELDEYFAPSVKSNKQECASCGTQARPLDKDKICTFCLEDENGM